MENEHEPAPRRHRAGKEEGLWKVVCVHGEAFEPACERGFFTGIKKPIWAGPLIIYLFPGAGFQPRSAKWFFFTGIGFFYRSGHIGRPCARILKKPGAEQRFWEFVFKVSL